MPKRLASMVGLCLVFIWTASPAEGTRLTLCAGPADGNYFASGEEIKRQVARQQIAVELIETNGSTDNLTRMASGDCDAGFAQIDAYLDYQSQNRESRLEVEWPRHLYDEYVHLVCRRDTGFKTVSHLTQAAGSSSVAVGSPGSGSSLTWNAMTRLRPDYLAVETRELGGAPALEAVKEGAADCLIFVSGLNSEYLALIEQSGEQLGLVAVDDEALLGANHYGKPIYSSKEVPEGTYSKLRVADDKPFKTLAVRAILLVSSGWAGAQPTAFDSLIDGVKRATPIIQSRVGGQ